MQVRIASCFQYVLVLSGMKDEEKFNFRVGEALKGECPTPVKFICSIPVALYSK